MKRIDANQIRQTNQQYYDNTAPNFLVEVQEQAEQKGAQVELQQRKILADQITALREKNMTEQEKNQKVISEVKNSKEYSDMQKSIELRTKILKTQMKGQNKCQIHGDRIFKNENLLNPKCRHCKKINEVFLSLLSKQGLQNQPNNSNNLQEESKHELIDFESNEAFPIYSYGGEKMNANLDNLMRTAINSNKYFHEELKGIGFDDLVAEVVENVTNVEPWILGANNVPSTIFCCFYRLIGIKPSEKQITSLLKHQNVYLKCLGLIFVRYVSPPQQIWDRLKKYVSDKQAFVYGHTQNDTISIGDYITQLLTERQYLAQSQFQKTVMPRIPVLIEREIQKNLIKPKYSGMRAHRERSRSRSPTAEILRKNRDQAVANKKSDVRKPINFQMSMQLPVGTARIKKRDDYYENHTEVEKVILDPKRDKQEEKPKEQEMSEKMKKIYDKYQS